MNLTLFLCLALLTISITTDTNGITSPDEIDSNDFGVPEARARLREGSAGKVSRHPCLWVTGYVRCPDSYGEHDGQHVVVRFVDGSIINYEY